MLGGKAACLGFLVGGGALPETDDPQCRRSCHPQPSPCSVEATTSSPSKHTGLCSHLSLLISQVIKGVDMFS